jgi:hypothetical protein
MAGRGSLIIKKDICLIVYTVNKKQIIDRYKAGINLKGSE